MLGILLDVCNAHDSAKISDEPGGSDEVSRGLMLDVCSVLELHVVSVQQHSDAQDHGGCLRGTLAKP
jgi:hypothetical protein